MLRLSLLLLCAGVLAAPVQAADFLYTPKDCEFRITYPEQPSVAQACNPQKPTECHEVSNFTRVLAIDSSVRISTTCNNAEPGMMERYSGEIMEYTLGAMAKPEVDDYETGFNDHGIAKQAIVLGNKKLPDGTERVYMAQLWIGKKSVFTVEGQVTGASNAEADALFSDILKSIHHESWENGTPATGKAPETDKKTSE